MGENADQTGGFNKRYRVSVILLESRDHRGDSSTCKIDDTCPTNAMMNCDGNVWMKFQGPPTSGASCDEDNGHRESWKSGRDVSFDLNRWITSPFLFNLPHPLSPSVVSLYMPLCARNCKRQLGLPHCGVPLQEQDIPSSTIGCCNYIQPGTWCVPGGAFA
ncbi:uncharacterized protein LOC135169873 [Diachasmimorpha longicaudata]|uniref:uncharacterized protein LOC135169873 n=1 Tax=Diachasmimorpha longicaudata TaxID=58733 RepID=UPI0030B90FF4